MADRSGTAYIFNRRWGFQTIVIVLFVCLIHLNPVFAQPGQPKHMTEGSHAKTSKKVSVVKEGVAIELSTRALSSVKGDSKKLVEGC